MRNKLPISEFAISQLPNELKTRVKEIDPLFELQRYYRILVNWILDYTEMKMVQMVKHKLNL